MTEHPHHVTARIDLHGEEDTAPARPAGRVVHEPGGIDLAAAEEAAGQFLNALGISTTSESLRGTPGRMARAYGELFSPRPFDLTTSANDEGYGELVLARLIPVRSVCEHHLLSFAGTAHVGYLPGARILGLSKLACVVEYFACRPQVQERLTKQVADWLQTHLEPKGVGVVIEAEHACMTLRGVQPTRQRERAMKGFRSAGAAQRFLSAFSGISPHFGPRRHLMTAAGHRAEMTIRFVIWDQITGAAAMPTAA
ncbi:GTP cyclohydrolase I FolE [Streptomyces sp. NPDC005774]|uniref:GTP cyclohydrolase I FolE n=1 Tax=Streptomyces sp. NPDC005774 TaxID=3364728 RepID=UPI0036BCFDD3